MSPLFHHRRLATLALLAALPLLILGCANPNGAIPSQSLLLPPDKLEVSKTLKGVTVSEAHWPKEQWWSRYADSQLDALLAEALAGTPSLRIAAARLRQAQAMANIAEASDSIQANASLKDTRQRYSKHSTIPSPLAGTWNTFNDTSLNLSYEFDFWGKNEASIASSLDRLHAAEVDERAAQLMLTTGVIQSYLHLAQFHDQLDLYQIILKQRQELLALTQQRVVAGIDSQVELKQAESAIPSARQQIASTREEIELTKNQLSALLGKGPDRGLSLVRPMIKPQKFVGLPSVLPADLIGRRPDIVAMRWRAEAARQDIRVARAQFMPNVSLLSFIGFQSLGFDQFINSGSRTLGIGPAISLPIFDGGRLRGNLGARNAEYDIAVEQYNQTVIGAVQDVVNQLTSIRWHEEQHEQQLIAVSTAQTAYELAVQRYRAGVGTYLQALTAELQLNAQKKVLLDIKTQALLLDANLIRSLGGSVLDV
ncbi:efflux transporter, outer membrane factor (OMF) lipoprotein, NodT family [Collimonas sp. OK607]|uniref:efflux transporter outer membrane subunit n=1 Tax=Collimonas sp. OK607 TaxID=1798194 RepID=UPI0008E897C2|nr:efflux transporter outer membrane subunit [Collimonas sp. OK607]SFB20869.1 efflux transporter, outer membrane factor (OMF) lipoprotein, NodT family [Collimonas sp. OK607]